jgi:hypothetical protein
MMPSMLPPYCMTTNQIKLEKRFHNGTFWYIRDVFGVLSMAMMVSKISSFVNAADGQSDCITTDTNGEITPG